MYKFSQKLYFVTFVLVIDEEKFIFFKLQFVMKVIELMNGLVFQIHDGNVLICY